MEEEDDSPLITREIIKGPFGVEQVFPELNDEEIADIFGDNDLQSLVDVYIPPYSALNEYAEFLEVPAIQPFSVDGRRPQTNPNSMRAFMKLLTYHKRIDEFSSASYKVPSGITKLDDFQEEAVEHIKKNHSIVVVAPTGAGITAALTATRGESDGRESKTEIALTAIAKVLRSSPHARVFYISPTKALVNQIYLEVMTRFGGNDWRPSRSIAGILTADFQIATHARVIVTVPQIFEKMLVNVHDAADFNLNLGYVILDEIHLIQDKESGSFWERILLLLPEKTPFVALSATIGNARQFTDWITVFHPNTFLIQPAHSKRHVPLVYSTFRTEFEYDIRQAKSYVSPINPAAFPNFYADQLTYANAKELDQVIRDKFEKKKKKKHDSPEYVQSYSEDDEDVDPAVAAKFREDTMARFNALTKEKKIDIHNEIWFKTPAGTHSPNITNFVKLMRAGKMLPAILFQHNKSKCSKLFGEIKVDSLLTKQELETLEKGIELYRSIEEKALLGLHGSLLDGLRRGIGIHHAGLSRAWRYFVERMFRNGLLKIIVATATLAVGIHMPCYTAIFWEDSPFLTPSQFHQMCGRAGRRGFDSTGNVLFVGIPGNRIRELMTSPPENLIGQIDSKATVVLGLAHLYHAFPDYKADYLRMAKNIIRNTLSLYTNEQHQTLVQQMFQHVLNMYALRELNILSGKGNEPSVIAYVVNRLDQYYPNNLVIAYFLQRNRFFVRDLQPVQLVNILSYFAPIVKSFDDTVLDRLPDELEQDISAYNRLINDCVLEILYNQKFISEYDYKTERSLLRNFYQPFRKDYEDLIKKAIGPLRNIPYYYLKESTPSNFAVQFFVDDDPDATSYLAKGIRKTDYEALTLLQDFFAFLKSFANAIVFYDDIFHDLGRFRETVITTVNLFYKRLHHSYGRDLMRDQDVNPNLGYMPELGDSTRVRENRKARKNQERLEQELEAELFGAQAFGLPSHLATKEPSYAPKQQPPSTNMYANPTQQSNSNFYKHETRSEREQAAKAQELLQKKRMAQQSQPPAKESEAALPMEERWGARASEIGAWDTAAYDWDHGVDPREREREQKRKNKEKREKGQVELTERHKEGRNKAASGQQLHSDGFEPSEYPDEIRGRPRSRPQKPTEDASSDEIETSRSFSDDAPRHPTPPVFQKKNSVPQPSGYQDANLRASNQRPGPDASKGGKAGQERLHGSRDGGGRGEVDNEDEIQFHEKEKRLLLALNVCEKEAIELERRALELQARKAHLERELFELRKRGNRGGEYEAGDPNVVYTGSRFAEKKPAKSTSKNSKHSYF